MVHIFNKASSPNSRISKHDAIIAHVWSCINRARSTNLDPYATVYLDQTLGIRQRLSPPLPDNFLGSPIVLAAIKSTPFRLTESTSLPVIADQIRNTLKLFDSQALAAHLHDAAFEPSPQRLWQAFLGKKHVLLTTWIHLGVWDIRFGGLGKLRCVQPVMPVMDGLVEIMEAGGDEKGHWTRNGVDVSIYLEAEAMKRLELDERIWGGDLLDVIDS